MAEQSACVGVDLGGTSLMAAVVSAEGEVLGSARRKTKAQRGADVVSERIAKTISEALASASLSPDAIGGVGVGVPGPLDPLRGIVHRCPNLGPSWDDYPLAERLEELLARPVALENDVNVGAVGEHTYGAGRGADDMMALFVGTGIGGGLILDGALRSGFRASAGEVGHMVLLADGPMCGCGQRGHAEALASRTAIERDIRAALQAGRPSALLEMVAPEDLDATLSSGILYAAWEQGDPVVVEAIYRAQFYLGLLVSACVNLIDPEVVVLGGGMIERFGDDYLEPVRHTARQHYINKSDMDRVRIVSAALGDLSGAMGAAVIAAKRFGRPADVGPCA